MRARTGKYKYYISIMNNISQTCLFHLLLVQLGHLGGNESRELVLLLVIDRELMLQVLVLIDWELLLVLLRRGADAASTAAD